MTNSNVSSEILGLPVCEIQAKSSEVMASSHIVSALLCSSSEYAPHRLRDYESLSTSTASTNIGIGIRVFDMSLRLAAPRLETLRGYLYAYSVRHSQYCCNCSYISFIRTMLLGCKESQSRKEQPASRQRVLSSEYGHQL